MLNKRVENASAHTILTEKDKHDGCVLAERDHELMCVVKNCKKEHNTKKRRFFGLFHCNEHDILLLDPDEVTGDEPSDMEVD